MGSLTTNENVSPTTIENENFLPRIIVDYSVKGNGLLYGSYSEGNLPGGFNSNVAALTPMELAELRTIDPKVSDRFSEPLFKSEWVIWV